MAKLKMSDVRDYVANNISTFHDKRLEKLHSLKLSKILKRKNPYLFKAKNILTAPELVRTFLDAYLSSQEETLFGDFLEELAIFINARVYGGVKSSTEGIDLEFTKNSQRYIVSIKSGPNWGNSAQIQKMKQLFDKATRILRTSNSRLEVVAVNGCCYGRDNKPDKGSYFKYCGQLFWEFISGDASLYLEIIEPLGHEAKEKNEEFQEKYAQMINNFSHLFMHTFCKNGYIEWDSLLRYNSSAEQPSKEFTRAIDFLEEHN